MYCEKNEAFLELLHISLQHENVVIDSLFHRRKFYANFERDYLIPSIKKTPNNPATRTG